MGREEFQQLVLHVREVERLAGERGLVGLEVEHQVAVLDELGRRAPAGPPHEVPEAGLELLGVERVQAEVVEQVLAFAELAELRARDEQQQRLEHRVALAQRAAQRERDLGVLVGKRVGAPVLVISQDVFPEIATELDRLRNPAVIGVLRGLVGAYLRRADRIVAIGETMRERLEAKGAPPERLRVIPNWVDTRAITPQPRDNEWATRHDLVGRFVAMHSGNVGHAQDLDSLVRAATFLRDRDDVRIVIAGFGARHGEMVALAERLEVTETVRFLPYQKRQRLPLSLSSADVHVIGLAKGLAGYVVPSRLYGVLSAGRAVVVAAEDTSETARLVREVGCGVVIPPARPDLLARTIREASGGTYDLDEMGRRGRAYVEEEADRVVAMERYRALVREMLAA